MSVHRKLTIGLFGFGVVGEGLYKILQKTPSLNATIKKVCIKHPDKKRNAPDELFTTDRNVLLNDDDINVIVEVINESEEAFQIVSTALRNGKEVVSASKKMIAEHFAELLQLQKETGLAVLYEASSCASIPIIRNLEEYYDNDLLHSIKAIVNGSTNFILTKMFEEKLEFRDALILAQQLGFAEADPKLDIDGYDALNKWVILLNHAYGIVEKPSNVVFTGIQNITSTDAEIASQKNLDIKLIAQAKKLKNGKVAAFVLPQFVNQNDHFAFVKNEYNGVVIESGFADKQFFYGKGAGSFPTASAVLSDISALTYDYHYEYKKLYYHKPHELTNDFYLRVYISFDDIKNVPKDKFEWMEEWHAHEKRKYIVGVLPFTELKNNSWWKENGTSLILMPDSIVEDVETRKIKMKSLELAGVFM
jgi:homoserine dehydrogenase